MNPDTEKNEVTESQVQTQGQEARFTSEKLVPVSESVRYRKRAQNAEKEVESLSRQLEEAKSEASQMAGKIRSIELESKLTRKLAACGAVDLETAILVAKSRIKDEQEPEIDGVIEQLKQEKQYLFGYGPNLTASSDKTSGPKDKTTPDVHRGQARLEKAARKAATSGNRVDLQEYLKLRRNFV